MGFSAKEVKEIKFILNHRNQQPGESIPKFEMRIRNAVMDKLGLKKLDRQQKTYIKDEVRKKTGYRDMDRELRIAENRPPTESDTGGIRGKEERPEQMQIVDSTSTPFSFTAPKGKAVAALSHVVTPLNPTFNPKGLSTFSSYGGDFTVEKLGPTPSSPHHEMFYYSPVWNSAVFATVPLSSMKVVPTQKIDKARVLHWKTEDRAADYDQQCKVMGCSAQEAAYAACVETESPFGTVQEKGKGWEWLHLVAFSMGGIDSQPQVPGNLVAGTYESNTEMMAVEDAIKWAVEKYSVVVNLDVSAKLITGTHVAREIRYTMAVSGTSKTVVFNTLTATNPSSGDAAVCKQWFAQVFGI